MNTTHFSTTLLRADGSQTVASTDKKRALVLGGGGSTGNAWLIGVIAGLHAAGLDVTTADLIIGTSAGATAAAQVTGASPARLLEDILAAETPTAPKPSTPRKAPTAPKLQNGARPGGHNRPVSDQLRRTAAIIAAAEGPADMRRRMGAAALELADADWQSRWRSIVASRLPHQDWPRQELLMTVVDASTGEPVVIDRHSGVELVDAVAASTSSGSPYRIGGALFIDGGYRRSSENADLTAGHEKVLVLSPFGGQSRYPQEWGMDLATQAAELRAGGSGVETIFPDEGSQRMFGANAMDPALRPPAARAGFDQGRALAAGLAEFWC